MRKCSCGEDHKPDFDNCVICDAMLQDGDFDFCVKCQLEEARNTIKWQK
jgi:hypothetical protein